MINREAIKAANSVVVKIGSALLTDSSTFAQYAADVSALRRAGKHVTVVSSGGISQGASMLGHRPAGLANAQALSSFGQVKLMQEWSNAFNPTTVAQFLLSKYDFVNPRSFLNARRSLRALKEMDVIPIGNENDTVNTGELKVGDNDTLSAHVAQLAGADLLIILTGVDGLYSANPSKDSTAKLISSVSQDDLGEAERVSEGTDDGVGTGGFTTKIEAVKVAFQHECPVVIANGTVPDILQQITSGADVGTAFHPNTQGDSWLMERFPLAGNITLRGEASLKMMLSGKIDLWMSDILECSGQFGRGDTIAIRSSSGQILGRGITAYGSQKLTALSGLPELDVLEALGPKSYDGQVLHPDDYCLYAPQRGVGVSLAASHAERDESYSQRTVVSNMSA
eukprot:NODE_1561_length_1684_cov_54.070468_g1483_i0.p1 GENE.NODE_1561_length_1684_cov_54.070468_g1483_i0~~NODE_1561_length_1684_cov_54.070468_g1483_i0.p1  ORF type:complete len:396 (-),score=77.49 NODE_1561_length_1684_cov_54.070468_g1483_i0:417-1604(-)